MKKSKVAAVLAMALLLPLAGCTSEETSSTSQPPADLVLNENQGVRMIKEVDNGYREPSTFSVYFDINFGLSHQVDDKKVMDYPAQYTSIRIEQPREFDYYSYENAVDWQVGTLYDGILKVDFNFPDYIWESYGFDKDNEGNWVPGPIELLEVYYPLSDTTYLDYVTKYQDFGIATGSNGNYGDNFFLEVYDL